MNNPHEHPKSIDPNQEVAKLERARKIGALESMGRQFHDLLHNFGDSTPGGERFASRELALAATKIDEAVLWATKHVTK